MKTILFLHSVNRTSITQKLEGVLAFARPRDWSIQTIEGDITKPRVKKLLAFWKPLGVLVECGASKTDIQPSLFGKTPVVFLDRNPRTLDEPAFCIKHDSFRTAQLATRELLSLQLNSYAYVPTPVPRFWCEEREAGFAEALNLNGLGYSRFKPKKAADDPLKLQSQMEGWLKGLPLPAGIFAANDRIGATVLAAAAHLGIEVPAQLAVLGVDNNELLCENTTPSLSSVVPDFQSAGFRAAELLERIIGNPKLKPKTETFGPLKVVRRASTNRSPNHDKHLLAALDLIRREACNGLKARDVAGLFPCSRRMAEIRFRKATGQSILDAIQAVRRAKAEDLLKEGTLDRTAIANFCGYSSANALANFLRSTSKPL